MTPVDCFTIVLFFITIQTQFRLSLLLEFEHIKPAVLRHNLAVGGVLQLTCKTPPTWNTVNSNTYVSVVDFRRSLAASAAVSRLVLIGCWCVLMCGASSRGMMGCDTAAPCSVGLQNVEVAPQWTFPACKATERHHWSERLHNVRRQEAGRAAEGRDWR